MHAPSDADARFDRTIERWFRQMLELDPEGATYLGVHDHDDRLSDGTREHVEQLVAFHRAAVAEMERFPADDLSPDRALDRDLVIHEARLAIHQLSERREWAGSSRGAEHIGNALFPIFTRDYAPLEERLASIAARLEAAPAYLAQTRTRVDEPVRLWVEIDIEGERFAAGVPGDHRGRGPLRARGPGAAGARPRPRPQRCAPPWTSTSPGCAATPCRVPTAHGRPVPSGLRAAGGVAGAGRHVGRDPRRRRAACWPRRRRAASGSASRSIRPCRPPRSPTWSRRTIRPPSRRRSRNTARPWIGRATSSSSTISPPCRTRTGCG